MDVLLLLYYLKITKSENFLFIIQRVIRIKAFRNYVRVIYLLLVVFLRWEEEIILRKLLLLLYITTVNVFYLDS